MEFFGSMHRPSEANPVLSRRKLLTASVSTTVAATSLAGYAAVDSPVARTVTRGNRMESRFVFYADPIEHQRQSYRILRNLHDDADVLFWYHFTMFTVVPGGRPEPVVRWEGIELSHHRKLADGVYRIHGHNLSFPRDLRTGQWTNSARNPVTGAEVEVPPMALTEDPGYVYTPEGVIPLDNPDAAPRIRIEQFLIEDDLVKIEQVRLPPASWPATFVETSANWSSRELFEDTALPSLPAGTAGAYVFPWPAWMQMEDQPGHMFANWSGRKLTSVSELPEEFLRRAQPDHAELLGVNMAVFNQPLPEPLASRYRG